MPLKRPRTAIAIALVAAVTAGLAGCSSDDDEPSTLPKVSSTASTETRTATPSSSTPATPTPKSTAELEAEVERFFDDYIDTVNASWTSPKALDRRRTMFEDSCSDCLAGYLFAKRAHDENLTLTGDDGEIVRVEIVDARPNRASFISTENLPARDLVDDNGNVVQRFDPYQAVQILYEVARNKNRSWVITRSEVM